MACTGAVARRLPPHHHNLKSQPLSVGIFFAQSASVGVVLSRYLTTPLFAAETKRLRSWLACI